jgi:hypothetical protein
LRQEEGDGIRIIVPEESQVFKVAYKKEAVQDKIHPNYRLSEHMQQEIRNKVNLKNLDFSNERFKIGDKVMGKSDKKRKRQDEF